MSRYKTFEATGIAPNGRLFAGDLNAIQDLKADLYDLAQNFGAATVTVGEGGLQLLRYGAGEARISGALRTDGILRGLGGLFGGSFTTAARDAIAAGGAPYGLIILNSTTNQYEWNKGSDGARNFQPLGPVPSGFLLMGLAVDRPAAADAVGYRYFATNTNGGTEYQSNGASWVQITTGLTAPSSGAVGGVLGGTLPNPDLAATVAGAGLGISSNVLSVGVDGSTLEINADALRVKDNGITAAKIAAALKGGAAAGVEALRALGTTATTAAAGNDSRFNAVVVGTTVAAFGTATEGKIALLVAGSSPYYFKIFVYSATYGKWVSETRTWQAGSQSGVNTAYADSGGNTRGADGMEIWRPFDTAGFTPQLKLMANLYLVTGGATAKAVAGYRGVDDAAATGVSLPVSATEITTTSTTASRIRAGAWAPIEAGYAVKDYLWPTWMAKTTNGANEWSISSMDGAISAQILVRWVA